MASRRLCAWSRTHRKRMGPLRLLLKEHHVAGEEFVLVGLFDGIGGARRACELAKLPVATYWSSEISVEAKRVTRLVWPDVIELGAVQEVSDDKLRELALQFPRLKKGVVA